MLLIKIPYWLAGFACGILIFVADFLVKNNYSFYTYSSHAAPAEVKSNLHSIYLSCKAYWADTKPANTCNAKIASRTAYGYVQSANVTIWGETGGATGFSVKGKHSRNPKVYNLDHKGAIRELKNNELKSALAEMNKQTNPEKKRQK